MRIDVFAMLRDKVGRWVLLAILLFVSWLTLPLISEGPVPTARLNGNNFSIEVARTLEQRNRGLSGREQLLPEQGMLFIHEQPGKYCYWMKDMKIAIDILWFDQSRKLIHIEQNASPASYPKNFCPPSDALYVLEIRTGMAGFTRTKLGDELFLTNL
jgi:uncharacterized protein